MSLRVDAVIWFGVTALAVIVGLYGLAVLLMPATRPPIVEILFANHPNATLAHLAGGAIALLSGALQLSTGLRTRFLDAHRWMGRLYVLAVTVGGASGFILALHTSGGHVAGAGFALLAVCWMGATLQAYRAILQRQVHPHRRWMIRSYALTLAAVTLRIYLPSSQLAEVPIAVAYPAIAWLSWVPNLIVAEVYVRRRTAVLSPRFLA